MICALILFVRIDMSAVNMFAARAACKCAFVCAEAGAAKKVAAARCIQSVYRGHAVRRSASLLRLAQRNRALTSPTKTPKRSGFPHQQYPHDGQKSYS